MAKSDYTLMSQKHRYSVFAHGSNPAIDRPLCRKSEAYCEQQIADGLAEPVYNDQDEMIGIEMADIDEPSKPRVSKTGEFLPHVDAHGPITGSETVHNATGVADRGKRKLFASEMRAMAKVQNYGPATFTDRIINRELPRDSSGGWMWSELEAMDAIPT